jgi:hypothetical protein
VVGDLLLPSSYPLNGWYSNSIPSQGTGN